ncbi:zinc-dependent alcohol dehydrogenase [Pseudonocardia spinosispora]|uniref:zinc-dependent alcohol dehydrogenase n=1 Tax=Pseudonocardia spinosispora TaxID=103441 RepID=UPI000413AC51|nr:alcohol dehydrogenase catalytic domain-containing protein [Pseudonocardia spinosispora]
MRQLMYLEPGRCEWSTVEAPTLTEPGQALVRPLTVATCDLDVAVLRSKVPLFTGPFAFGHESICEVVEVGDQVRTMAPGDRVVLPFQISCGACSACTQGRTGNCQTVSGISMYGIGKFGGGWGGVLTELVLVPYADAMLVALPAGIDPLAVPSAVDNLPDAWRTVAPALTARPAADVLISAGGAGSVGLYATGIAAALGAGSVTYVDNHAERREVAARLGATVLDSASASDLGQFPITVDASARPEGLALALRATEPDGVCTSVGIYYQPTEVPLFEMYLKGITFHTGRVHARAAIPGVLDLVATGAFNPATVTSAVVSWEDAPTALADPPTKLVIARPELIDDRSAAVALPARQP